MNWYYLENGAQRGPVTEAEFSALFQVGTIGPQTYLWCEGMTEWKRYGELLAGSLPSPAGGATSEQAAASTASGLRVRREEALPDTERTQGCSQCGTVVPVSQLMRIGSASLCPKCQVGYRRQAHFGFGDRPADYANPFVRLGAFILDCIICFAVGLGLVWGATFLAKRFFSDKPAVLSAVGIGMVICLFLWILDYFVGRITREGATPGMKLCRIKVVTASGGPVGGWRALGRWLMIGVTNTLLSLGHLIAFFDKERRSLHDIVCGTIVIKR